jgi:hypothetical protein
VGLAPQNCDGGIPNVRIHAKYVLQIQKHPRRMQDNDGENVQAWHECGQDDGLWEIAAYEIES